MFSNDRCIYLEIPISRKSQVFTYLLDIVLEENKT